MLTANYHTHTTFCDGKDTPSQVAAWALQNGLTHLGFSGHMDPDIHMDFETYAAEIHRLQKQYASSMDILLGVELDTLYDPSCANAAEYVIGSTHFLALPDSSLCSVDSEPERLLQICDTWFGGDPYRMAKAYFELEETVYDRTRCSFVGHFDLITRYNDDLHFLEEDDPRYLGPAKEAMRHLVSQGVPFEINCGAVNRGRKQDFYPSHELLRSLHDFGGEIFINSDAHQKELLTGAFDQAIRAAIRCGFTHTNILEHDPHGAVVTRSLALDLLLRKR